MMKQNERAISRTKTPDPPWAPANVKTWMWLPSRIRWDGSIWPLGVMVAYPGGRPFNPNQFNHRKRAVSGLFGGTTANGYHSGPSVESVGKTYRASSLQYKLSSQMTSGSYHFRFLAGSMGDTMGSIGVLVRVRDWRGFAHATDEGDLSWCLF